MPRFKIPEKVQLFGQVIKVKYVKNLQNDGVACNGLATSTLDLIEIDSLLSQETSEAAFFHELMHHIFWALGRDRMSDNETLVQSFGCALHQYVKTAKYGKDKQIPDSFQIFAVPFVVLRSDIIKEEIGTATWKDPETNNIHMINPKPSHISKQATYRIFLIQVVHQINWMIGQHQLMNNEKLEHLIAGLIHQVLTQAKK